MTKTTPYALLAAARAALITASTSKPPEITPLDTSPKERCSPASTTKRTATTQAYRRAGFRVSGSACPDRVRDPDTRHMSTRLPGGSDVLASHRRSAPHQEHDNDDNQDHDK
jgi:hypothetical protein